MAWREPVVKAVAGLGFALILLRLASVLWSDDRRSFELPTDKAAVTILDVRVTVTRSMVVGFAVLALIAISLGLAHTRTGPQMRALADNRRLSSLIGYRHPSRDGGRGALSGLLFGFAGLVFGDLVRLDQAVITVLVVPCTSAAIAGRLQSLPDVLLGGLAIGLIESLLTCRYVRGPLQSPTTFPFPMPNAGTRRRTRWSSQASRLCAPGQAPH